MNMESVVLSGGSKKIERLAHSLVVNTLSLLYSGISIVAIKIDTDGAIGGNAFKYQCIILVKLENGNILRSKACDCDEILAIYKALSKTIDSLPPEQNRNEMLG